MAESKTKKRAAPKRVSSSRAKPKSSRSKSKSTKTRPASSKARSAKPKSRSTGSTSARRSSNGSSGNDTGTVASVRHAVEDTAKTAGHTVGKAGQTVGRAANKAKVPLIAGGAALAGAAGGLALATRQDRHAGLIKAMRKPKIKLTSRDVARAAKEVGNFGAQVGELANELQRAREQSGRNGRHRSPVEVVLQGLTTRR
jgi:cytoskeletal protein RodZ